MTEISSRKDTKKVEYFSSLQEEFFVFKMTLNEKELEEINTKHMITSDKWFRMYCGVSSRLIKYEDDNVHIVIDNNESRFKSDEELAKRILVSWLQILKSVKMFVIYIYKINYLTGFILIGDNIQKQELKDRLNQDMQPKENPILVNVFSGNIN